MTENGLKTGSDTTQAIPISFPTRAVEPQGIPLSTSFQPGTASFLSPDDSPESSFSESSDNQTSSPAQVGNMTEPRNYAPRTSGFTVMNEPPPKFDLSLVKYLDATTAEGLAETASAVKPAQLASTSNTTGFFSPPPSNIESACIQQSTGLNNLTNTACGLPSISSALAPNNFPFMDSASRGSAKNNGVVKLRNVSAKSCCECQTPAIIY